MAEKCPSPWFYAGAAGGIIDTADNVLVAATPGMRNFLSNIQFINTAATPSELVVKSGAVIIWRGYVGASQTQLGWVEFDPPLQSLINTALNVALITTATATRVSAQGFVDA